jgi:hypothetical protein
MTHENINQHIDADKQELNNDNISPQRRRHIEDELGALESYKVNHPNDDHDPNALELYCDSHPDASECRIYED